MANKDHYDKVEKCQRYTNWYTPEPMRQKVMEPREIPTPIYLQPYKYSKPESPKTTEDKFIEVVTVKNNTEESKDSNETRTIKILDSSQENKDKTVKKDKQENKDVKTVETGKN